MTPLIKEACILIFITVLVALASHGIDKKIENYVKSHVKAECMGTNG